MGGCSGRPERPLDLVVWCPRVARGRFARSLRSEAKRSERRRRTHVRTSARHVGRFTKGVVEPGDLKLVFDAFGDEPEGQMGVEAFRKLVERRADLKSSTALQFEGVLRTVSAMVVV